VLKPRRPAPGRRLSFAPPGEGVKKGEATGRQLAYLTDRLLVADKRKQLYGTQLVVVARKFEPAPIDDEANVDRRRKEVGLLGWR
jgi:hypothetical protein